MKIKHLEMQGFKSFVDRTPVDFDLPIIAIVGPNGCGKSNVVDAIRWVMGEQSAKHLRGKAMEDVIFNGSAKRAPVGMSSVSLTFNAEDGMAPPQYAGFSEITVTRRLFRSGESEYLINKVPCRLRDILDLFLGTGAGTKAYSVIEQGQVDFAINAKPEDRRRLIEEAAGISKFKVRRDAALRRMEATQNNLLRLGDILAEIRRQIRSLERQVKKAERFRVIRDELRQLDLYLSSLSYLEKKNSRTELETQLTDWQTKESAADGKLATGEATLEKERLQLTEEEQALSALQEKIFEVTNRLELGRTQKEYKEQEIGTLTEQISRWQGECDEARQRIGTLEEERHERAAEAGSIEEMTSAAVTVLKDTEAHWQSASEKRNNLVKEVEACRTEIARLDGLLDSHDSQIQTSSQQRQGLEERHQKNAAAQAALQKRREELSDLQESIEKGLAEISEQKRTLSQRYLNLASAYEDGQSTREERQRSLSGLQEQLVTKRSRLRSLVELEKSLEGYAEGVRAILKERPSHSEGILGMVADLVDSEPKYEAAIAASLGERLQFLVVESQAQGIGAIDYLKREAKGRSSFIPKQIRARRQQNIPSGDGILGPLLEFVRIKSGNESLGEYLFGDVVLVDSLPRALQLWDRHTDNLRWVTLDGEMVDAAGVISGGREGDTSKNVLAKRREIDALRNDIVHVEQEIGLQEDAFSQLEGNLSEIELEKKEISAKQQELEVQRVQLEKDKHHHHEEDRRSAEQLKSLQEEADHVTAGLTQSQQHQADTAHRQQEARFKAQELRGNLQALESKATEAETELQRLAESYTEAKVKMSSVQERQEAFQRDLARLDHMREDLGKRIESRTQELSQAKERIEQLKEEIVSLGEQIALHQEESDTLKKTQAERQERFNRQRTTVQENELALRSLRKELDVAKSEGSERRIQLTKLEGDIHFLTAHVSEKYSENLPAIAEEWSQKVPEVENPQERADELRAKLDKLGDVNLGAIPEFEELREREVFLSKQYEDLETALENLQKVIRKINLTTRQRFDETFKQVQEKFATLFPRLFKGGRAELRLDDPSDLLNTGVQIMVQPPGKRLSHVSLLSGGEKALSAVAFIFSIFLVKPSPFCILDEVDAPLDDANTGRFLQLIQEMTHRTQFILITHNKMTMEMANGLYGVTMQEPGVSKVVSVHLDDIEELPKAATA